jgi:hypothetical protein
MNTQTRSGTERNRIDPNGRAFAGSQRQIQTYVNSFPDTLNAAIAQSFGNEFQLIAAFDGYPRSRQTAMPNTGIRTLFVRLGSPACRTT